MQSKAPALEAYAAGLLAVLERLPVPIAVALDRACDRVHANGAFALLAHGPSAHAAARIPLERAAAGGEDVTGVTLHLEDAGGTTRQVVSSAWAVRDSDGEVCGAVAIFGDAAETSALAESERRYRLITEAMPQFVWLDGPDGSALYANERWLEYTGLTPSENAGFGWESVVHPEDRKRLESERARTLLQGEPYENECRYRGKDGKYRWFLFRSIPVRDGSGSVTSWLGTATDIDKQKRAEAQQTFFALASDVLASTLDVAHTLERIARLAIVSLGTWCQIDIPDEQGRLRTAVVAHGDPDKHALLSRLLEQCVYDDGAALGPPAALRDGTPQLLGRVNENAVKRVVPDEEHRSIYRAVGYAGGIIVPLRIRDRILGTLGIASDDPTRLYTDFDVATAMELGRRGAIALENARSFEREHRLASTLQRALLPSRLPDVHGVVFHSAYSAADSAQGEAVGGDWYDAFPLGGGRIAVSVGDVAGHGVDAAVTMGVVRQAIRAAALEHHAPREVLARANRMLVLEQRHSMITAFFGIYNTGTGELTYCVAGHPRPLVVDTNGNVSALDAGGPPLGEAFDEVLLDQTTALLPPHATLAFFTDGLIEYARDVLHAERRLHGILGAREFLNDRNPAQAIIDAVLEGPQSDDIAVLVMRIGERAAV